MKNIYRSPSSKKSILNGIDSGHMSGLLALGAIVAGAGMDIASKYVAPDLSAWQAVFLRWIYGAVFLVPIVLSSGTIFSGFSFFGFSNSLKSRKGIKINFRVHGLRLVLNLVGSVAYFYALARMDLSIVLSIFFLEPIFAVFIAALFFRQAINTNQILAIILGFLGVIVLVSPDPTSFDGELTTLIVALVGAFSWGAIHIITQQYGREQSTTQLVFWLAVLTALASAYPASQSWNPIDLAQHGAMILVAVFGTLYSYMWIKALKLASAASIVGFAYLALPLAYVAGAVLFDEKPELHAYAGSALIMISVLFKRGARH